MSSDLYVQSISRGVLKVRRRRFISGEIMICFHDPEIKPIHITDDSVVTVSDHASSFAIQRSNISNLIGRFLEVVL